MEQAHRLFNYLITQTTRERFELFAKELASVRDQEGFVPLGGLKDGGADGYFLPSVYTGTQSGVFYQFSSTDSKKAAKKIVDTITSLIKSGRNPKQVIYWTNEQLPKQDIIQRKIFEEHNVLVTVFDYDKIKYEIYNNSALKRVYDGFFHDDISKIVNDASRSTGPVNEVILDPTVFAILDYELLNYAPNEQLDNKALDSLIYWALRNTDPDRGIFLSLDEIVAEIRSLTSTEFEALIQKISARIELLTKKEKGPSSRIRRHMPGNKFCIPFDMRALLAERSLNETQLQDKFNESIISRLDQASIESDRQLCRELIFSSVHEYFIEQGAILAAFLQRRVSAIAIDDQIAENQIKRILSTSKAKGTISPSDIIKCIAIIRTILLSSTEVECQYLGYLSRTSLFFMTLKSAPKMIEYFNKMSGKFRLIIGTDILINAISEGNLPVNERPVDSFLKACKLMGATLYLAESVVSEIYTHLHAVDLEFRNHYMQREQFFNPSVGTHSDRLIISKYYEGKSRGGIYKNWDQFINSVLTPGNLRSKLSAGKDELKGVLLNRYGMTFLSTEDLKAGVDKLSVHSVAETLNEARENKHEDLAKNDALMAFAIYAMRKLNSESAKYDGFGFNTWWLTKETKILSFTHDLIQQNGGNEYIMRPEFILNFITLAPDATKVREVYRNILPTTVGIELGQYLSDDAMHDMLSSIQEWSELPPDRTAVLIHQKLNALQIDRAKNYGFNMSV